MAEDVLKDNPNPSADPSQDPALTQRDDKPTDPPADDKPGGGPADPNKPADPKKDPDKPGDADKPDESNKDVPEAYEKFSLPEGFEYDERRSSELSRRSLGSLRRRRRGSSPCMSVIFSRGCPRRWRR